LQRRHPQPRAAGSFGDWDSRDALKPPVTLAHQNSSAPIVPSSL
jgi:hypothetical protein